MKSYASDIPAGDWIDRWLPTALRPYLRLTRIDRPIGIWLLLLPCWWGTALASPSGPPVSLLLLFAVGAVSMRAAGCIINDIVDRRLDRQVARTANRPIASGAVSPAAGLLLAAALSLVGLAVLLQLNTLSIALGLLSVLLVVAYPFAKRVTSWPQVVLGLVFNWGALLGWTAVRNDIAVPALLLYGAGLLWTLGYDTIYAHQDKEDDRRLGIGSTALRLGDRSRPWLGVFYGGFLVLLLSAGLTAGLSWVFAVLLVPVAIGLAWQVADLDMDDPRDCLAKFKSNRWVGIGVFLALLAGPHLA